MKLNVKYFSAETYEAAVTEAEKYFECDKEQLTIEVVSGREGALFWVIFVMNGAEELFDDMNGSFMLYYEEDGVYLELYEKRGSGIPIDRGELSLYIRRKNLSNIDGPTTLSLTSKGRGREKIAPAQEEQLLGEYLVVDIPPGEREATARLLAPEKGGKKISFEMAEEQVMNAGIVCGYDPNELRNILKDKEYGRVYVIARAVEPEDGIDGKIIFHFYKDKKEARPKRIESGKVDYKDLDLYEPVNEGQLLVTKELPTPGTPGTTVTGKEIRQKPGRDVNLPKSKNTVISDDKLSMYSQMTGLVEYVGGSVNVTSLYKINGDCGMSVGNIDFDGSVHITVNVVMGHVIKATGTVIVGGVVEASTIIAGGNIEVKSGMQGMDRGRLEAGGSISILYIERGIAIAGENITVDASIHSSLEAGKAIIAKGKRGSIIGGSVRAAGEIIANTIGSISHAQTDVEVGFMPNKRKRILFLEHEVEKLSVEMGKLEKLESYLEKARGKMEPEAWEKLRVSTAISRKATTQQLVEYNSELIELREEEENTTNGKIHVFKTTYPNVKVTIGKGILKINNELNYSTFRYSSGEVIFMPCEMSS